MFFFRALPDYAPPPRRALIGAATGLRFVGACAHVLCVVISIMGGYCGMKRNDCGFFNLLGLLVFLLDLMCLVFVC